MQCSHCHHMVETSISRIKEDKSFTCLNCFATTAVDVDKLLKNLEALMIKVEAKKKETSGKADFFVRSK